MAQNRDPRPLSKVFRPRKRAVDDRPRVTGELLVPIRLDDVDAHAALAELHASVDMLNKKVAALKAAVTVTCARLKSATDTIDDLLDD